MGNINSNDEKHINFVKENLKSITGIEYVFNINEEIKCKIIELENEANGKVLMGMGIGDNQGIKEAFNRKYLLAVITNKHYKWPSPPNVIMMQNNSVIGFDCTESDSEKYKNDDNYTVFGTFVMLKNKVPGSSGKPIVVLPSKPYPELESLCGDINSVIASPSTPSDEYIHNVFNIQHKNGNGTIIVGFD